MEPKEDSLCLFCGRRTDWIKALYWSGDGYVLAFTRLERGGQRTHSGAELRNLEAQRFRWLLVGLKIDQPNGIRKRKQKVLFS